MSPIGVIIKITKNKGIKELLSLKMEDPSFFYEFGDLICRRISSNATVNATGTVTMNVTDTNKLFIGYFFMQLISGEPYRTSPNVDDDSSSSD